jgi:hypothetical protein
MGAQTKTVGGQPSSPLAKQFTNFLMSGLAGGQFGTGNPQSQTMGIGGVLNDILSGGAGKLGGSLATLMQNQQMRDVDSLRARFSSGSGSYGSGAQYAEGLYKAQAAPQITSAIGNLQLSALSPLLGAYSSQAALGTPQAQTLTQPSQFSQVLGGINSIGQTLGPLLAPMMGGGAAVGKAPNVSMPSASLGDQMGIGGGGGAQTASNGVDIGSLAAMLPFLMAA